MAISDTDVLIQFILRSVDEMGPGVAAARAQLAQLEVQTRATGEAFALSSKETQAAVALQSVAVNDAAVASNGLASKTVSVGTAAETAGTKVKGATLAVNDLKVGALAAGAASERNALGLIALAGGAMSAEVAVAAVIAGLAVFSGKTASDVNTTFQRIQANTLASNKELEYMRTNTLQLANDSSKSWSDIAAAYAHASNEGFHFAQATEVVTAGLKGAEATGASTSDTVNTLSTVLRDFHDPASRATQDLVEILGAAAKGNIQMPDLIHSFTLVASTGAAMHQPLSEVAALYSTLTQATGNASKAQSEEERILTSIISPTKQAQTVLAQLSATTGIDLVRADKDAADGHLKLSQYMELVRQAADGNNKILMQLFGGIKGGTGALVALGNGWDSYRGALDHTNVSQSEAEKILDALAGKAEGQYSNQIEHLGNQVTNLANDFGQVLVPALGDTAHLISSLIAFDEHLASSLGHVHDTLQSVADRFDDWQGQVGNAIGNTTSKLAGHAVEVDHVATRYGVVTIASAQVAQGTGRLSDSVHGLTGSLSLLKSAHEHEASALDQLLTRYTAQTAKVDSLASSYDRLIAASKAYTASAKSEGSAGVAAATSQLQSAIAPLAPDFRAALQPVLDGFISQLASARADYFSQVRDEDASYQESLLSLHNTFLADSAGKDAAHVAALKQTYEQSVTKLGQEHDRSLAGEKAAFETHVKGIEAAMRTQSDPGAIFASGLAGLTQKAQDDLNRLSYALATGKGSVDQLSAAAIRGALSVQHGTDISTAADLRVALGMGDLSRATADYQKQLAEATSKLAGGILGGDSKDKLEKLTAAGAKYEVSILHISKANDDAAMRIARASGDFGTYLSDYQKKLQDVLSNAEGRFISDQQSGNTGALPADRQAVDEARSKLQHLTNTVNELDGKLKTASDFSSLSAAASDRASKALGAYALALEEKKPDVQLESLRQKAQAAADEADKYTKAQALATTELARSSHDVVVRMDAVKQSLTDTLQRAIDQGASDLRLHGAETNKDREAIARASKNLDVYNEEIAKVTPGAKQLVTTFAELDTAAKTRATSALDALALAELKHTGLIGQLTDRAALAAEIQANTDQVMIDATLRVAKAMGDFAALQTATNNKISSLTNTAAGLVYTGQTNAPTTNLTPQQIREERIAGKTNTAEPVLPTEYKQTIDQLVGAEKEHLKQEQALNKVNTDVFTQTGEYAKVLGIVTNTLSTEVNNALAQATLGIGNWKGALDQAATDQEAQNQRSTAANNAWVDSEVRAALKAGDLSTAFGLLSSQITGNLSTAFNGLAGYFLTGVGDLGSLVQAWQNAKTASDQLTQANYNAFLATGQYSSALGLVSQKLSGDFSNAVDKVTLDLLNHSGDLQADTAAAQAARSSSEALTQAQWDSSYATGSATTKMQMLESSVQGVISNFNSMQSANAAVSSAQAGVTAAQAQIGLGLLQSIVTNTQDMTAVMSASAALSRSIGNEQLVAVRDQAGIITSQGALDAAMLAAKLDPTPGNLAAIAVARDQLQIQVDTARADYQAAVWLAVISKDNLTIASDKLASDRANEAAQAIVDQDKLRVAVDTEHLAVDQMKLTADTLPPLLTIASAFADVSSYQSKIDSDLQSIGNDQNQIGQDNQQLASDTSAAAMVVQQGLLQQALDSQKLAADQAASDASSQAGQLKIAQDGIQLAEDNVAYSKATAASVASIDKTTQQQLADMTVQRDSLLSAFRAAVEGIYNPHVSDLDRMLTGYTAEAHAAGTGGL